MRRTHLLVGLLALLVFVSTGQFMLHHNPSMAFLPDGPRLLYRPRHIYILAAAIANLLLGLYLTPTIPGWRRVLQHLGSAFFLVAPLLLTAAFLVEPGQPLDKAGWSASYGLFALFLGNGNAHSRQARRAARRVADGSAIPGPADSCFDN